MAIETGSGIYVHLRQQTSATNIPMSLIKIGIASPSTGTVLWGSKVWDAVNAAYGLPGTGGIAVDSSSQVYSCMVMSNAASTNIQTLVMKYNGMTGAQLGNVDLRTLNAVDCNVFFYSSATKLLVAVVYSTGTTELINFNAGGTTLTVGSSVPRLKFTVTGYT